MAFVSYRDSLTIPALMVEIADGEKTDGDIPFLTEPFTPGDWFLLISPPLTY